MLVKHYKYIRIIKLLCAGIAVVLLFILILSISKKDTTNYIIALTPTATNITAAQQRTQRYASGISVSIGIISRKNDQREFLVPPTQDDQSLLTYISAITPSNYNNTIQDLPDLDVRYISCLDSACDFHAIDFIPQHIQNILVICAILLILTFILL
jgi:hypothetical protein